MTTPVIIDAVVVVILVGFAVYGACRGLLRSVASLVIVIVALVGAGMIASTFAPPVAKLVTPVIESYIGERVQRAMEESELQLPEEIPEDLQLPELDGEQLEAVLTLLGLDAQSRAALTEKAQEAVKATGASVASAVVESLAQSFIYGILYILAFLLLLLLLHILLGAMDLVMKLPGLHMLNMLGGGLFGLAEGALLLFLAVWIARKLGVSFETAALAEAHILHIFTNNTPLSVLSFLQ